MYERNLENFNLCVDSIKGQFGHILNKHEQDFIRAYQVTSPLIYYPFLVLYGKSVEGACLLAEQG
jgi:hypothetical protein